MNDLSQSKSLAGRRILVVEDELLVADEIARALRAGGAGAVSLAPNIRKAMALIDADPALDAAVIDVNLAGDLAYPVADALAARNTPFVFATAYQKAVLPGRYRDAPHCAKPMRPSDLIQQLLGALAPTVTARASDEIAAETSAPRATANLLLQDAKPQTLAMLHERGMVVALATNRILRTPGVTNRSILFPLSGVISISRSFRDGESVETHLVGREGAIGLEGMLDAAPSREWATVTLAGEALQVGAMVVRDVLAGDPDLLPGLHLYQAELADELKQRTACALLHRLPERLAGWLLRCRVRAGSDELAVTQEHLGHVMGAQRTTINAVAREFRSAGLLNYTRGAVRIRDRAALELRACDCHREADPAHWLEPLPARHDPDD